MNCSISGKVPEEPVVLKNSGYLFEKRLIERHISYFGKCPVTGEPLTLDDIVYVKTGKIVKPRLVQASSIPRTSGVIRHKSGMLNIMNDPEVKKFRERLLGFRYQSMNGFTNCFSGNNGDAWSRFYKTRAVVWRPQNEDLSGPGKKELEDFIRVRQKEIEELWELKRQEKREKELKKKRKELKKLKREKKLKKAKMAETTNVDADGCPLKKLKLNVVEDDLANVEEVKLDVSASEDADQPREVVLLGELAGNLMEEGLKLCAREAEKKNAAAAAAAAAAAYSKTD